LRLVPYCVSKFALVGLYDAMRVELGGDTGITMTTVYSGRLRTGAHLNALFKGQQEKGSRRKA